MEAGKDWQGEIPDLVLQNTACDKLWEEGENMQADNTAGKIRICSFCGKSEYDASRMFSGAVKPGTYICETCVGQCMLVLDQDLDEEPDRTPGQEAGELAQVTPAEMKAFLDQYVIGQEEAKRVLSVAVYNHYKRLSPSRNPQIEIQKSNVLMAGPSGSGKTLLAETLAKALDVPFAVSDATSLTEAGYVGEDVESMLTKLLEAAGGDVSLAERGIIYLDEVDKIGRAPDGGRRRDVSGEGVQQALLKIVEGTIVNVPVHPGRSHGSTIQEMVQMDTRNILFIFGGAFVGIERIVEARTTKKPVGFVRESPAVADNESGGLIPDDFIKFGLIPELVGRVPVIVKLDAPDEAAMVRILEEPKNSITKQYEELFRLDGVKLVFETGALRQIAKMAMERKTGARGLKAIVERAVTGAMYDIPSNKGIKECIVRCGAGGSIKVSTGSGASGAGAPGREGLPAHSQEG